MTRRTQEVRGWLRIVVPRDNRSAPFTAEQLYAAIHATLRPGEWAEIALVGRPRDVGIWLGAEESILTTLGSLVLSTYPDAELEPSESPLAELSGSLTGARWELAAHRAYPVKTVRKFENSEPVAMTLGALAEAGEGEIGVVHLALTRAPASFHTKSIELSRKVATGADLSPWWSRALLAPFDFTAEAVSQLLSSTPTTPAPPQAQSVLHRDVDVRQKWILSKAAVPAFRVTIRTAWQCADRRRAMARHGSLVAALGQFAVPGQNALLPKAFRDGEELRAELVDGRPRRREKCVLGIAELAAICHLPGPDLVIPHLRRTGARRREQRLPLADGALVLGTSTHRGGGDPVGVRASDLMTHAYVLGPSGTGKTTLLVRLVLELARTQTAAVVLDPHGDLVRQLLLRLPDEVIPRVKLLDLGDPECLPTVNPLWLPEGVGETQRMVARAVRSAAVTSVFSDIWGLDRATTPNLLHFLEAALAALIAYGDGCLAELPRFLTDGAFRGRVLARGGDTRLKARWAEFAALSPDDRSRTVRAILNKAADFDRNPILATVFGDPGPGIRVDEVMDSGGILLVNLPRGLVPEGTVELLGSLLVTQLYQAALAREARRPEDRPPVVAVIDEFQEFALSAFAKIVTATRKYGLGLVVANQNLSRVQAINPDVLSTLLANVGTLISFRAAPADASVVAPLLAPFDAADLMSLAPRECYLRAPAQDGAFDAVSARTLPPGPRVRDEAEIEELCRRIRVPGRRIQPPPATAEGWA